MVTKLANVFGKEPEPESIPEPIAPIDKPLDWNGQIQITEIREFKFSFKSLTNYYIDRQGDLLYIKEPTKEQLDALDRDEFDNLFLKMGTVRNPNLSPQVFYDASGEPVTVLPGESASIKVSRKKTRITFDKSGHCFLDRNQKLYKLVNEFSSKQKGTE